MTIHRAVIDVSPEFLAKVMGMPEEMVVVGVSWNFPRHCAEIYVMSPDLPETVECQSAIHIQPTVTERPGVELVFDYGGEK